MTIVATWNGRRAQALRSALRMTHERFAEHLGLAPRAVAKWDAQPDLIPVVATQQVLDIVLSQAEDDVRARFSILLTDIEEREHEARAAESLDAVRPVAAVNPLVERRLLDDPTVGDLLGWLDECADWPSGEARRHVTNHLAHLDIRQLKDRAQRRGLVTREHIAGALADYYDMASTDQRLYRAHCAGMPITTSILTHPRWCDLRLSLDHGHDQLDLEATHIAGRIQLDEVSADGAARRLAEGLATDAKIVNSPLYQVLDIDLAPGQLAGTLALTDFVSYALTMDLLENELIDALTTGRVGQPAALPLRDRYLPNTKAVLGIGQRLCAGGPLALLAVARPGRRSRRGEPDYLLLVQERSGRVLNSARRLAVIPKSFHGPLVDIREDAQLSATLEREMEEELFGREELDSTIGKGRQADPMHLSRLSEPMRWLAEHGETDCWRTECTGFGFNLVSGNYEFACLIVIEEEEWWTQFGGHIEANWESEGLRRYSSLDRPALAALVHDASWSNEGLFAFLQGLRRLGETGGSRVKLPSIELEM